ncbi:MAG: helix-turn-helix domain-containing protein [Bacteroidia bacterium]|nr:helix-turn-helix domain-containing protein [Bacteroidia bacterium]
MSIETVSYNGGQSPESGDVEMARAAIEKISKAVAEPQIEGYRVSLGGKEAIRIPAAAYALLVEILEHMAQGKDVALMPLKTELTTQQAADYLNVSRPFLVKLLTEAKIPYRKVGAHRRIRFEDVAQYKRQIDTERSRILDELTREAQDMGLGY